MEDKTKNEACQLWIEQRIDEELEEKGVDSLRTIGRTIALEIYRTFEVRMTPEAIKARMLRRAEKREKEALVRCEPPQSTPEPSNEIQEKPQLQILGYFQRKIKDYFLSP